MPFKFEGLEVWQRALAYIDLMYEIADQLPRSEDFNLKSQITRAATSAALNVAEGSTSQSDPEQARFLGLAIRSVLETVACQHIISRRNYLDDVTRLRQAYRDAETLVAKLQTMRKTLNHFPTRLREDTAHYSTILNDRLFEPNEHLGADRPNL